MRPATHVPPVETYGTGVAVSASLFLLAAAAGLVLAATHPVETLAVATVALTVSLGRRLLLDSLQRCGTRQVCVSTTNVCVEV